jgi:hypothetical protein
MATAERTVVKKVPNAVLYSDGCIRIDNVRASYPHLDAPWAGKNDDGDDKKKKAKYGIVGLLPKDTHKQAKDLVKEAILHMLAENETKVSTDKWFLTDGDKGEKVEEEGHFKISARETKRPTCRNRDKTILDKDEVAEVIYGGCYVNILIRPWYQDGVKVAKGYGKRINAGLVAVQFVRDGEPFGEGGIDDEGVFDDFEDDDGGFGDDDDL